MFLIQHNDGRYLADDHGIVWSCIEDAAEYDTEHGAHADIEESCLADCRVVPGDQLKAEAWALKNLNY
jgi:hypothetical protein